LRNHTKRHTPATCCPFLGRIGHPLCSPEQERPKLWMPLPRCKHYNLFVDFVLLIYHRFC
jgi:hypothetical protein